VLNDHDLWCFEDQKLQLRCLAASNGIWYPPFALPAYLRSGHLNRNIYSSTCFFFLSKSQASGTMLLLPLHSWARHQANAVVPDLPSLGHRKWIIKPEFSFLSESSLFQGTVNSTNPKYCHVSGGVQRFLVLPIPHYNQIANMMSQPRGRCFGLLENRLTQWCLLCMVSGETDDAELLHLSGYRSLRPRLWGKWHVNFSCESHKIWFNFMHWTPSNPSQSQSHSNSRMQVIYGTNTKCKERCFTVRRYYTISVQWKKWVKTPAIFLSSR